MESLNVGIAVGKALFHIHQLQMNAINTIHHILRHRCRQRGDSLMVGQGCSSQHNVRDFCIQTVLITMLNIMFLFFFICLFFSDVLVFLSSIHSPVHTTYYSITDALISNYNFRFSPECAILHSVVLHLEI